MSDLAHNSRYAQQQSATCPNCDGSGWKEVGDHRELCDCRRAKIPPAPTLTTQPTTRAPRTKRPASANSQFFRILELLRERGSHGANTIEMIHQHHIIRPGARIAELREAGVQILTKQDSAGIANYILLGEPDHLAPIRTYGKQPVEGQRDLFEEAHR